MKTTAFLPVVLAFTAAAEMQLYSLPTPVKRDINTVTSVVAQISDAITQLDSSVKTFESDSTQLKSDADNLVSTIKSGASAIASAGAIELSDALGLQDVATSLTTAGQTLIADLQSKKDAFEASQLCGTIQSTITSIGSEVQGFVDAVVKQLPTDAQEAATQLTSGIAGKLSGVGFECKDKTASSSSAAGATETPVADNYPTSSAAAVTSSSAAAVVTVTVTAPCVCESSSASVPVVTPSTSVPYPTGGSNTTSVLPTGSVTTTSATTIPTAGAGSNGVGAVGLMAGLAAALLV
ncbi:hydrophobic surface binding protein A-domain-containing protein [Xylaria telfairii]|nr:hydrophobic surface binding protein A-domain-containing protein [Xylaria telfairii]